MLQKFILNNKTVSAAAPEGSTLLDYIRYHQRLMGTKFGCREGDCGACTVLVGSFEEDKLVYRSMTSCLVPLGNVRGKHVVTVEGINMKELSPVQQAMVDTNGTQCGFCTLGFVMSFTGFVLSNRNKSYEEAIAAIDGNICRCTGYKSIERSAKLITKKITDKPIEQTTGWLIDHGFIPPYFGNIEQRLREIKNETITYSERFDEKTQVPIAGGTDLVVQKALAVKQSSLRLLFDVSEIKEIKEEKGICSIGGGTTVTEFLESKIIRKIFPDLQHYIKLVSSTPIRNMATMAGNLVNASPIGDMTIFFLALDAGISLAKEGRERNVALKDFYKGYKQTDKEPGEIITRIYFKIPDQTTYFNFEKVAKRTNLDIASVNAACQLRMTPDGCIETIHLSAGGVAPFPKYLSKTCTYLAGKKIETAVLEQALAIMNEEIAPISDARGGSQYKRLLLRQLIIAHFLKFFGPNDAIRKLLFQ